MKLRIKGDSLRLRLTRPEVEGIGRGKAVEATTHFPDGASLRYRLETSADDTALSVCFSDGLLTVRVGLKAAVQWSSGAAVEIACFLPLRNGGELRVLVEKDFECLHPGRGERTDGAFPNPARPIADSQRLGPP